MNAANSYFYPDNQIDPRLKGYDFILQYVKAAFSDNRGFIPTTPVNAGQSKMEEIKEYVLGKQPVDKYKKQLLPQEQQDNTWLATDWSPLGWLTKLRNIIVSICVQREYDIQAFAIDPLAKSEEDAYFNKMKIKIMMREAAAQAGSPLANSPQLQAQPGEPEDMDALKMEMEYGYKHIMSMNAELANSLVFQQNGIDEQRKQTIEGLVDYGIAGYVPHIDENGKAKFRAINAENLLLSYCAKPDFSDLTHWGEMIEVYVGDLAPHYTKDQLNDIVQNAAGKWGNPTNFAYGNDLSIYWNKFKVMVLDFEFLSWNTYVYENKIDQRGNPRFNKTKYQKLAVNANGVMEQFNEPLEETGQHGEATPKYQGFQRKVIYKCKWVIQTDYMHEYGLSENMIRKQSTWTDTQLNIVLYAWNFYKMKWSGITEKLIKLEDDANLTWFRMQNLRNKLIPYLINVDFTALEGVNFGKGGGKASPEEVADFIFSNFIVPWRSTDLVTRQPGYKPVSIEATGMVNALVQLREELLSTIAMMGQLCGLNEVTDASTINPKNLNSTNTGMVQSTNNALFLIMDADKKLLQRLADANVCKVQIAVKLGKVSGYLKALGQDTVSFLEIDPDISNHEFGIFMEDAPTDEERQLFWQGLNQKEYAGLIEPSDKILVMSCRNLKQADILLAYRIKKRKEEAQANSMALQQQQSQGNMQVAQATEQMKQQTIQIQHQADMELANLEGQWNYIIETAKKAQDVNAAHVQANAKVLSNKIMADAKINSTHVNAGTAIINTNLDNLADIEKEKHKAEQKTTAE